MRERGPFEYDKFVLNILQIHNAIKLNDLNELGYLSNNQTSLKQLKKEVDSIYLSLIGTSETDGIVDSFFKKFI